MPSKLTTEEFITKAQAVHGDKYDYSEVDYQGATLKIAIICSIHGIFKQSPRDHLKGCGCPQCGKQKQHATYSVDDFIVKAREIHGNKYDYSKVEYINNHTKICIICPEHGEFWQTPGSHTTGRGCPKCGRESSAKKLSQRASRYLTQKEFIERAHAIHGNKYDYSEAVVENSQTKVKIICPIHGVFEQSVNSHLSGQRCPKCAKSSKTTAEFIAQSVQIYGDKYDYSLVEYHNNNEPVAIVCPEHGVFWQLPRNHLAGKQCPLCGTISRVAELTKTTECFIQEAKKVHGDKYDYSKVNYKNSASHVCIICPKHGEFWQMANRHLQGQGCPVCGHEIVSTKLSYTTEDFIAKACEVHGNKYNYSKVEYHNNDNKVCIECPEHGDFWQTPGAHLSGQGCPQCGLIRRATNNTKTTTQFISEARRDTRKQI